MKKIYKYFKKNFQIILILLLALFLRFYKLDYCPPSLNWDEVSHGFNAYSILKSGNDEWGKRLPLIFRAYGDYKLPVYIYLTSISEWFFGLSVFSVRFVSAFAGAGTVFLTYLLTNELFKKKQIALLSSFFVAVEPWSLFLSRGAFEANLSLFFVILGVYFFIGGIKKNFNLILSALFFGLSLWTYNSARIFVPLLLFSFIFIYWKILRDVWNKNKTVIIFSFLVFLLFLIPVFTQVLKGEGTARFSKVSILDEGAISEIDQRITSSKLPKPFNRILNNKAVYFAEKFALNYLRSFSPDFLFYQGGKHYQFNIPGTPLLYTVNAPFILIGLFLIIKQKGKEKLVLFSWLFLSPIASSLTKGSEVPHTLRQIVMIPIPMILGSIGIYNSWKWISSKKLKFESEYIIAAMYLFVLGCSIYSFFGSYLKDYRSNYSWSWQYGYKETVEFLKEKYPDYEKIIISKEYGEPHEFILFYWPWDPVDYYENKNLIRFNQSGWWWVDRFDKFYFVNDWDIPLNSENFILESGLEFACESFEKCLLVTTPGKHPGGWSKIWSYNFLDGQTAFEIYEK
ncbi:glycosyltransferase family 39 protein [Patescibacteria group bacterium]|nr:glycosyltransferase family 39 protein [Patescibacteria group bacterium]